MKPYQHVAIVECGEPLLPIPEPLFALVSPHPYATVGAPYGEKSPFYLREGVLKQLAEAQAIYKRNFLAGGFRSLMPIARSQCSNTWWTIRFGT
jgi:D-alanyl-D-alanine dipeptidase